MIILTMPTNTECHHQWNSGRTETLVIFRHFYVRKHFVFLFEMDHTCSQRCDTWHSDTYADPHSGATPEGNSMTLPVHSTSLCHYCWVLFIMFDSWVILPRIIKSRYQKDNSGLRKLWIKKETRNNWRRRYGVSFDLK